jgi:hypothetical protein
MLSLENTINTEENDWEESMESMESMTSDLRIFFTYLSQSFLAVAVV